MRALNKSGSILIITLWILIILSVLALGLGRRCAVNLRIAAYQRDRLRAEQIARAGVKKAIWLLENEASDYDTEKNRGIALGSRQPQDVFVSAWGAEPPDGFKIGNFNSSGEFVLGFQDEESCLNLNVNNIIDVKVLLKHLFEEKNITPADEIARTVIDWADADIETDRPLYKNKPFATEEELLAALECAYFELGNDKNESRKQARQTYDKLKGSVTVFADKINVNTAPIEVLRSLALAAAEIPVGTEDGARDLAAAILISRVQNPFKSQDELDSYAAANASADAFWAAIKQNNMQNSIITYKSEYFRFAVIGSARNITKEITVIYHRAKNQADKKIVYWHEK